MTLGDRIREVRKARALPQKVVAEAMGVSVQAISQWETGKSGISMDNVLKLARLLTCSPMYLLRGHKQETTFAPNGEDQSIVPIIPIEDAFLLANRYDEFFKHDISGFHALTDISFEGNGFAIYVTDNNFSPEYIEGDLLFFDTGLKGMAGDIVLAGLARDIDVLEKEARKKQQFSMVFSLWKLEHRDLKGQASKGGITHLPLDRSLAQDQFRMGAGLTIGTLVERRTYRRSIVEQGLESVLGFLSSSST